MAGLQLAVDEYKRVLPKIEQERHELQTMKKQLEFDNATLAHRCDKASEQYNRDQATIADLNERLGGFGPDSTPTSPAARERGGLGSELNERSESGQRLQAKIAELKDDNRKLQSSRGESEAKIGMLEQMIDDVREHSEEREEKHLETYQENLVLQSSLQALQKGQRIQECEIFNPPTSLSAYTSISTDIFKKTQDRLEEERRRRSLLEQQLKSTQEELRESQNDCMSWKSTYWQVVDEGANYLSVSLVDQDKLRAVKEVKKQQSVELTNAQKENKALKRRTVDLETDRAGLQNLLRDHIDRKTSKEDTTTNDDLKDLLTGLKAALPDRSTKSAKNDFNEDPDKYIDALGKTLMEKNAQLSAREEVQRQADKFSKQASSAPTPQLFPSTNFQQPPLQKQQEQSSSLKRRSIQGRFSAFFGSGKANNKQSNVANQEAERRASKSAELLATPPIPPPPTRAAYLRKDWDIKRSSHQ